VERGNLINFAILYWGRLVLTARPMAM